MIISDKQPIISRHQQHHLQRTCPQLDVDVDDSDPADEVCVRAQRVAPSHRREVERVCSLLRWGREEGRRTEGRRTEGIRGRGRGG
eukprot:496806-Rhodomonas_salina.5